MFDAVCDIRISSGATVSYNDCIGCDNELPSVDLADRASLISNAPAGSSPATTRRVRVDTVRALTAAARKCQGTRTQWARSTLEALSRPSRNLRSSDSPAVTEAVDSARHQTSPSADPRRPMYRHPTRTDQMLGPLGRRTPKGPISQCSWQISQSIWHSTVASQDSLCVGIQHYGGTGPCGAPCDAASGPRFRKLLSSVCAGFVSIAIQPLRCRRGSTS